MGDDDVLFKFRLRLFSLAEELGNVRAACRAMGVHPSTYYHPKAKVEQSGLEMLRPRERRSPRMPNQLSPVIEQRILAFSIAHPGLGPRRISASLAQDRWGGIGVSPNGVWKVRQSPWPVAAHQSPVARGRLCGTTGSRTARARTRAPYRGQRAR